MMKENILCMTSAMTLAARHELRDVRDGRDMCEDVKLRDFVDRARNFLAVGSWLTTLSMLVYA